MNKKAGFLGVFHIWSTRGNLQPNVIQCPGINSYNDKNSVYETDQYSDAKRKYVEGKGEPWILSNKRPERMRETLNELEELLEHQYVCFIVWKNTRTFQMVLSNCFIISVTVAVDSPHIEKIFIDKSLPGKPSDYIYDGLIEDSFMVFSFLEKAKLMVVNYAKRTVPHERREQGKVSLYEPKISLIDLPGPCGRKVKRHCLRNLHSDLLCVWWVNTNEEAWPWSPITSESDRANVVLLSVTAISSVFTIDIAAFTRTDGDFVDVVFSHKQQNQLLTIEQSQSSSAKFLLDACVYELIGNKISRVEISTIPIKSQVVYASRNYMQNKIVLACLKGPLILWDEYKRKTKSVKTLFNASQIVWHPADSIFVISSVRGDIQIFDIAMNCVSLQLVSDELKTNDFLSLSQYFFTPPKLKKVFWAHDSGQGNPPAAVSCCDDLLLVFERGPVAMLRVELGVCSQGTVTPLQLICEYIKFGQLKEAVALLNSLNWNTSGALCFQCLVLISDHIFKRPFNSYHEGCLEDCLGSFYAPTRPLAEGTILQFRDDVSRIARRFFHHLLRHKRFEKAFLLAVDISAKDLFMDIHYLAMDVGNTELAVASKERALQIHSYEESEGLTDIPVDYLAAENYLIEVNHQIKDLDISQPPHHEKQSRISTPLRQQHFEEAVRYDFDESDDDIVDDDPVAWALASRAGKLQAPETSTQKVDETPDDLQLVHFGNV